MILFNSFIVSIAIMFFAWLIYLKVQNAALIDVFWAINICLIGIVNLSTRPLDSLKLIALLLLTVWAMRLSLFLLFTRVIKGKKDPRYETMAEDWSNKSLAYLAQYLLQGLLAWIIALPFFTMQYLERFNFLSLLCAVVVFVGIIGESIADFQLLNYKKSGHKGICKQGLWQYSRHPNYFFECLVWLGFSVMGASIGLGLLSLLSIITLFSIMWFITIPITEQQSLKKRKEYQQYQQSTCCLFPWKPKA